ncbi:MAG: cation diffusion facilitator family transporter [Gammaproteobacteria bacterium]|nr:cation diffusion facilitator family transporter [Gammaproteobacteria bacterium]
MTDPQPLAPERRAQLLRFATGASVTVAGVLIVGKLGAWLATGSVTVLASLVDSLMDAVASAINLMAVRYSLLPADDEHRFGHGKAEALAGLGQATFIAGSALFLLLEAVNRLLHPEPLEAVGVGIGVMVFAILATLVLLGIQRRVIRLTGSTAIRADALHYATDLVTNISTIAALTLAVFGWHGADPLFALAIAGYILYSAFDIGREAVELLMDRELPDDMRERIRALAYARPEVLGVHDLRTRQAGHQYFVQLHLELKDDLPLREAHAAADAVEESIRRAFPNAEVIVHQDPVSEVDRSRIRAEPRPAPG